MGEGEDIQYFWDGERILSGGAWHFIRGLDNHLETMLYYLTLKSVYEWLFILSQ